MTDEEARELFGAALDDALSPSEREAFDAQLRAHPTLADEYERFQRLFAQAAQVHRAAPVPDLLPGVQKKLRDRGRRGLGDGTAQLRGRGFLSPLTLGLVLVGLLAILWLAMRLVAEFGP